MRIMLLATALAVVAWLARRFLWVGVATPLLAQGTERAVYLAPVVRAQLAAVWDSTNARQHERAYCLGVRAHTAPSGDTVYVVLVATRVIPWSDGPAHIQFSCGTRATLHTHVPTTCRMVMSETGVFYDYASCYLGGPGKDVTWPSPGDYAVLEGSGRPFDIIQFGATDYTVYYPRGRRHD